MRRNKKFSRHFYENLKEEGRKYCPICEETKLVTEFRAGLCVGCSKEAKRKVYAKHKDRYSERYQVQSNTNEYYVYKFVDKDNRIIYCSSGFDLERIL